MNVNCSHTTDRELPLHVLLRRRRQELRLTQAEVAAALRVSPVCVTLWEAGSRRMDLAKLPRLAATLEMDLKDLCAKALTEFYPGVFASLLESDVSDGAGEHAA